MTELRLYELAHEAAFQGWKRWRDKHEKEPTDRIAAHGEERYWAEYRELSSKLDELRAAEKEEQK